jgi:RHS repeat-associated protein
MTFDDNGNLLTQTDPSGTITYTWDARNRLTAMSGPSVAAAFAYDTLGRRAQKTIGSTTTDFLYDGLDVVKESSGGADVAYLRTLSIDEVLARADAVDTIHYLGDALGSSVALTNASGATATTYTYEPFGQTEVSGTPNASPFQFTGRENDTTGLYYYRAWYYDPGRGRFIREDPIGLAGGANVYAYAQNSPIALRDPKGLHPDLQRSPGYRHPFHGYCLDGHYHPTNTPFQLPCNEKNHENKELPEWVHEAACEIGVEVTCELVCHGAGGNPVVCVPTCIAVASATCPRKCE